MPADDHDHDYDDLSPVEDAPPPTMLVPKCPVCREVYVPTRKPRLLKECGHTLCTACALDMRARKAKRCPVCVKVVDVTKDLPVVWDLIGDGPSSRVEEVITPIAAPKSAVAYDETPLRFSYFCAAVVLALIAAQCWLAIWNHHDALVLKQTMSMQALRCHTAPALTTTRFLGNGCVDILTPSRKLMILRWYHGLQWTGQAGDKYMSEIEQHYCFWEMLGSRINYFQSDQSWVNSLGERMLRELPLDDDQKAALPPIGCLLKILLAEIERRASWLQYETNCVRHAFTQNYPATPVIRLDQHPYRDISGDYYTVPRDLCEITLLRLAKIREARQAQIATYKRPSCDILP